MQKGSELKTVIVSSNNRQILDLKDFIYIYIPMSDEEKRQFAPDNIDACWRIKVEATQ